MLKRRQTFGKYRVDRRLAQGGFADVFQAYDTVEGIRVALKIPHAHHLTGDALDDFRKEVRLTAALDNPHILPIKNAGPIDGVFCIVYPLGLCSLDERLGKRLSVQGALDYGQQILEALAFAHRKKIVHCDVKPENFILFPGNRLRLADFGIAKMAVRTLSASGSGTVGYLAPEQAMGRPSLRSDVFAAGLILYRMLAGTLPKWPFDWPPPGFQRLKRRVRPEMIDILRRALEIDERKRFADCGQMLAAFRKVRARAENPVVQRERRRKRKDPKKDWQAVRRKQFVKRFGKKLDLRDECGRCGGPMSESMLACPWCGRKAVAYRGETKMPCACKRCKRGMKLDWAFCAFCYGASQGPRSDRSFSDKRYEARCPECKGDLMPYMQYCPWCRTKVRKRWKVGDHSQPCARCGWGVLREFWDYCPWCARKMAAR